MYSPLYLQKPVLCRKDCNLKTTVLRTCDNHRKWLYIEAGKFYSFQHIRRNVSTDTEHSTVSVASSKLFLSSFQHKGIGETEINTQWVINYVL